MDRQNHVSMLVLLNISEEGSKLTFASGCLDVPRGFGFSYYLNAFSPGVYVRPEPIYQRRATALNRGAVHEVYDPFHFGKCR